MKLLIFAATLFAAQAKAAPLTCTIPLDAAVIESTVVKLTLSDDGKEIVQTTDLWPTSQKLEVVSDTTTDGVRVIRGNVIDGRHFSCPGSCPQSTFELTISPASQEDTPNGQLTIRTQGFVEGRGPLIAPPRVSSFICK